MKKLLFVVSCFVVLLVLSKMSFAQEVVVDPAAPCPCAICASASPFAGSFAPPQRLFGGRLAGLVGKRAFAPQMMPAAPPIEGPVALPYPYGIMDLKPRAVRRVARLTPKPQPYPVPYPVAVMPQTSEYAGPQIPSYDGNGGPFSVYAPGPVAQTGLRNHSSQRSSYTAPVINFLSFVKGPQPGYFPYHPQQ